MTNLSDLTIIVPTYKRQKHALKQMQFWSGTSVHLHILDGTDTSIKAEDLKGFGKNVSYHHIPISVEDRMGRSSDFVDTPYVVMLCDDEFYIPSALESCMNFLEENKEFVACGGRLIGFRSREKGIVAQQAHGEKINHRVEQPTARERMITHLNPYVPSTLYAVQTAEAYRNSMNVVRMNGHRFSCEYIMETEIELAICYQGKSALLNELMWLRNRDTRAIRYEKQGVALQFIEWIKDRRFKDEVNLFYEQTAAELAKINGARKDNVMNDIKMAFNGYIKFCEKNYPTTKIDQIKNRITYKMQEDFLHNLGDFIHVDWKPIMTIVKKMQKNGTTIDFKQLKEIVNIIEKKDNE